MVIYVDDILITSSSEIGIKEVKNYLHDLFTSKDLGPVKYFLGIEIAISEQGMILTQGKYIIYMIKDAGLTNAMIASSPFSAGINLAEGVKLEN